MKPKRHNLLYLDSGTSIGGGQRSLLLLLKHLDKTRFRSFVGCSPGGMLAGEVRKLGLPVISLDLPEAHEKNDRDRRFTLDDIAGDFRKFGVLPQLLRAVRRYQIDLIHANSLATALLVGMVAKLTCVPIVMHKRYATSYGILDRLGERLVDRVILVSEATQWDFAAQTKQVLIYNGVELEGLCASEQEVEAARIQLNLNCNDLLVGVVTRITAEKGIHVLIEAMSKLHSSPRTKLIVVGGPYFPRDNAYIEQLKVRAKLLGIEEQVIFTGFLPDTRVITSLIDIVLVPSVIPEACPRTIIEAMAAGKPVIATPLGGSKELVTPETGILVPPENAVAFVSAIASLVRNPQRLREMGQAARLRAERFFSVEKNTRLTEAVYETLL